MEYKIRKPDASDIGSMCDIIEKIGIENLVDCIKNDKVKNYIDSLKKGNKKELSESETMQVGGVIMINFGNLILKKMKLVQDDVFRFISRLTDLDFETVSHLPLSQFAKLVKQIIKEPEFTDFISVVLESLA